MAAQELAVQAGVAPACQALGVSRATFYRRQRPLPGHQQPRPTPARALCESERARVLDVLACPRFVDRSSAEVVATLLDEGEYLCSQRTMYRVVAANQAVPVGNGSAATPCAALRAFARQAYSLSLGILVSRTNSGTGTLLGGSILAMRLALSSGE